MKILVTSLKYWNNKGNTALQTTTFTLSLSIFKNINVNFIALVKMILVKKSLYGIC